MRTTYTLLLAAVTAILLAGCDGKFVPDPIDPRLPRYSTEGWDAAGALVNGAVWRAVRQSRFLYGDKQDIYIQMWPDSVINIGFSGRIRYPSGFEENYAISFLLDNTDGDLNRFESLGGRRFSLGGVHRASAGGPGDSNFCSSSSGQLYIKSIERLEGETDVDYHISGTFSLVIDQDSCTYYRVTDGRFDHRVDGY